MEPPKSRHLLSSATEHHPAVHLKDLPGREPGLLRGEVRDGLGDLLGRPGPSDRRDVDARGDDRPVSRPSQNPVSGMKPGATAFTVIPSGPSCVASDITQPCIAAFAAP